MSDVTKILSTIQTLADDVDKTLDQMKEQPWAVNFRAYMRGKYSALMELREHIELTMPEQPTVSLEDRELFFTQE